MPNRSEEWLYDSTGIRGEASGALEQDTREAPLSRWKSARIQEEGAIRMAVRDADLSAVQYRARSGIVWSRHPARMMAARNEGRESGS